MENLERRVERRVERMENLERRVERKVERRVKRRMENMERTTKTRPLVGRRRRLRTEGCVTYVISRPTGLCSRLCVRGQSRTERMLRIAQMSWRTNSSRTPASSARLFMEAMVFLATYNIHTQYSMGGTHGSQGGMHGMNSP